MSVKTVLVILSVWLVMTSVIMVSVEGRYLPTRADNSVRDEMRDILQKLFETAMERKDWDNRRYVQRRSTEDLDTFSPSVKSDSR